MEYESLTFSFFLIFTGASIIATLALYTRQPLLVAYIALGVIIGPYGLKYITDPTLLSEISHFGILFLLFLLGLDMQPKSLMHLLKKTTLVAIVSSVIFAFIGYNIGLVFGFSHDECLIIGLTMMFSSTIIGIKLLPTTVLHHRRAGELIVGLLLLQDLLAIFVILVLYGIGKSTGEPDFFILLKSLIALPLVVTIAFLFVRYVLLKLFIQFDRFREYIFLIAIGWCLGLAELAKLSGLSLEIGAFVAGISIATHPISQYIANSLKPLRDFFLILFFFSMGAQFHLNLLGDVIIPAAVLAATMLVIKPIVFRGLLEKLSESKKLAWDVGFRLGQISEFSLLIAYIAASNALIGEKASHVIQATAIISFLISSYIVIFNYPTPIALSDKLRRD